MQAIMGWWEHVPFKSNHVEMVFDKMVAPCYGWLFPETEKRVNIGICYEDESHTKNGRTLFCQFLDKHYRTRLAGAVQAGDFKGHPISYSYRISELHSPGRLIIGEAGRMTHPATAEGIYQGMRSGMIAAEAVRDVVQGIKNEQNSWTADDTWMLEYGRGPVPTALPFALSGAVTSLDARSAVKTMWLYGRLVVKELAHGKI
jgi:flavin-dependent dehydrogenase